MVMRTIMALKRSAGKQLVLIMGNHETMNLLGNFKDAISQSPKPGRKARVSTSFADRFKFVFDDNEEVYGKEADGSPSSYYKTVSKWPAVVRIGKVLFMHGGLHAEFADFKKFNSDVREWLQQGPDGTPREALVKASARGGLYHGEDFGDRLKGNHLFGDLDRHHSGKLNNPFWDRNWSYQASMELEGPTSYAKPCPELLHTYEAVEAADSTSRAGVDPKEYVMVLGHSTTNVDTVPFAGCSCWDGSAVCTSSPTFRTGSFNEGRDGNAHIWAIDAGLSRCNFPTLLGAKPTAELVIVIEKNKITSVPGGAGRTTQGKYANFPREQKPFSVDYSWDLFDGDSAPEF